MPGGHRASGVNADIPRATTRNAGVTGDIRLLGDVGPILTETARLSFGLGFYGRDKKSTARVSGCDSTTSNQVQPGQDESNTSWTKGSR